ncbi:hypothetical protein [Marinobacter sp. OP 3.4]|uniref:hypothetical protein n=1 Tax=Marinobacter sp. OP 3.4 TaxID=3076501 RepID=UPI002E22C827
MGSKALSEYFGALQRLKQGEPERIKKGSLINKDNVAREAGRARGSIRNRPGFESLLEAIENAQKQSSRRRSSLTEKERIKSLNEKMQRLKDENNRVKARYMSLLYLNFEMAKKLRNAGIDVPQLGTVMDIKIEDEVKF